MSALNLSVLRAPRSAADQSEQKPDRGVLDIRVTRRTVLGASAFLGTSSSALGELFDRFGSPISFGYDGSVAQFSVRRLPLWIIDPARFAGRPRLRVREDANTIALDLIDARLPGTELPADLQCRVRKGRIGWTIELHLDLGDFHASGDLQGWLLGEQPLKSVVRGPGHLMGANRQEPSIRVDSVSQASIRPDWWMTFHRAQARVVVDGTELRAERLELGLPTRQERSLAALPAAKWTRFRAMRGDQRWATIVHPESLRGASLDVGDDAFEAISFESHERFDGVTTYFAASSRPRVNVGSLRLGDGYRSPGSARFALPLRDLHYAGANGPNIEERATIAGQSASVWLDAGPSRLELGDDDAETVVEIIHGGDDAQFKVAPVLVASVTPIEGALAVPAAPAQKISVPLHVHEKTEPDDHLCPACRRKFDPSNLADRPPCHIISVIRPKDLLIARFELINLHIEKKWFRAPRLVRADIHAPAYLLVHLPPQHVAERAFLEEALNPEQPSIRCMESRLACESRLVFRLRDEIAEIPYNLASLLNWDPKIFLPAKVLSTRAKDDIKPAERFQTDIGFPWRLHLSPDDGASWLHATGVVENSGRAELWHTRLVLDRPSEQAYPTVRAVWADNTKLDPSLCPGGVDPTRPFRTSLNDENRAAIVTATHDKDHDPAPVDARLFALSALGAWSDFRGEWLCTPARACDALERWTHIASMGRDQKVVVEERGFLLRTGHKANLVTETTREFIPVPVRIDGRERRMFVAFLRQRKYLKIKEPKVLAFENWDMHHRTIQILDDKTPILNDPLTPGGGSIPKSNGSGSWEDRAFWPTVGTEVFRFQLRGVDYAGTTEEWLEPLLFVKQVCESTGDLAGFASAPHLLDAIASYNTSPRRTVPFDGRVIALAPSLRKGDTEATVRTGTYRVLHVNNVPANPCAPGHLAPNSAALALHRDPCEPPFWPMVDNVRASIPAIETFLGSSEPADWVPLPLGCDDSFETFAALMPIQGNETTAGFHDQSDRSGGGIAPTPKISHLSRRFGPVGLGNSGPAPITEAQRSALTAPAAVDRASGADFFSTDATILGKIRLQDIITFIDPDRGTVPALQSLLTPFADGPDFLQQSLSWETFDLQEKSFGILAFEPTTGKTRFLINGSFSVEIGNAASARFSMEGRLETFAIRIGNTSAGARVHFNHLRYTAMSDGKTEFDVDIDNVEFLGILAFVQKLAAMLKEFVKKELGVEIDLQPDGLNIWMPPINLDKVSFGVVTLKNLNIRSWVRLPFRPNPVELGFSFARADAPCELSVGIYGGTAYVLVLLDSDTGGVRRFEAAFEFGILREVSFGPAHGRVFLLGGVFFSVVQETSGRHVILRAYIRAGGSVDVLGLITAYIDLYIGLRYESTGAESFLVGEASLTIGFKIGFIGYSATLRRTERIAGSSGSSGSSISQLTGSCLFAALGDPQACQSLPEKPPPRFDEAMPFEAFKDYWNGFESTGGPACPSNVSA